MLAAVFVVLVPERPREVEEPLEAERRTGGDTRDRRLESAPRAP
jgi:hypothetical protein